MDRYDRDLARKERKGVHTANPSHIRGRGPSARRAAASGPDARPRRGDDRHLPRRPRPDRRRDRAAQDHHRPRRQRPLHLGVHRVSADLDDQRPAVRQAVRPVRAAADLPVRHRRLHGRLAAGRAVAGDVAARRRRAASRASAPARCSRSRSRSSRDLFAPSERGRYQGLFGAVFGLSVLIGPAIGGLITDTIGWPFVFFFNLPIGAFVFFMVWRYLPLYHLAGERPRIDYLGAALFTAALVPILVGLTNKGSADWTDPFVGGLIGLGRADPRPVPLRRVAQRRADRAARPVPQPVVHDLGRGDVPGRVRVLRGGRLPAALVPGRGRLVGDGVGLPDAAAARRADLQRRRVRARS